MRRRPPQTWQNMRIILTICWNSRSIWHRPSMRRCSCPLPTAKRRLPAPVRQFAAMGLDWFDLSPLGMLMYSKEARNQKQEIDRQHHTIPNLRSKDKHCGISLVFALTSNLQGNFSVIALQPYLEVLQNFALLPSLRERKHSLWY